MESINSRVVENRELGFHGNLLQRALFVLFQLLPWFTVIPSRAAVCVSRRAVWSSANPWIMLRPHWSNVQPYYQFILFVGFLLKKMAIYSKDKTDVSRYGLDLKFAAFSFFDPKKCYQQKSQ